MTSAAIQTTAAGISAAFNRIGAEHLPRMEAELLIGLHRYMRRQVLATSPTGTRSKKRGDRSVSPGEYKGSHISTVGPQPGTVDSPGSLAGMKSTDISWLGTTAPHGGGIERGTKKKGRQRSGAGKWYSRIQGTPQAKGGVYFPARRKLRTMQVRLASAIIQETERRITGGGA